MQHIVCEFPSRSNRRLLPEEDHGEGKAAESRSHEARAVPDTPKLKGSQCRRGHPAKRARKGATSVTGERCGTRRILVRPSRRRKERPAGEILRSLVDRRRDAKDRTNVRESGHTGETSRLGCSCKTDQQRHSGEIYESTTEASKGFRPEDEFFSRSEDERIKAGESLRGIYRLGPSEVKLEGKEENWQFVVRLGTTKVRLPEVRVITNEEVSVSRHRVGKQLHIPGNSRTLWASG